MYYSNANNKVLGFYVNARGLRIIIGNDPNNKINVMMDVANAVLLASQNLANSSSITAQADYRDQNANQWTTAQVTIHNVNNAYTLTVQTVLGEYSVPILPHEVQLLQTLCKNLPLYIGIAYAILGVQKAEAQQNNQQRRPQRSNNQQSYTPPPTNQQSYTPPQQQQSPQSGQSQNNGGATTPPPTYNPEDDVPF